MTNKKCIVPENSTKINKPGYEEIHIPAPARKPMDPNEKLIPIASLPAWCQPAFGPGVTSLNRVQSRLAPKALETDENFLLCAPTGAGKTNVALLSILRAISHYLNDEGKITDLNAFKIVYIAPMKALVQEMVTNFSKKLAPFGMTVSELTGDQQLTKAQIASTQLLVTTPEKWDVVTRKNNDTSYTRLVRLVIIDEIHLLHDDRGPVLEALVARTLRQAEETQQWIRLVGLSATLPNYVDVGRFLRVSPKDGIFFFDSSYRPCPLAQQYVGIQEKAPLKRMQLMNDIVFEKVLERAGKCQVLVFVHSRKDTVKTAKAIRDTAIAREQIAVFLSQSAASRSVLSEAASSDEVKSGDLRDLLPYGFAIHHAGMTRGDRNRVEELFAEGHIQVLVSTATLAWGVNLPAHTVIIKGTQVYNPEKGRWCELSCQDVLQMLGRAGRPQFDTEGEGIILTTQGELQFYLSLLNQQLPIESQLMSRLIDHLNAEIVLGSVRSRSDAITWLGYSYLFVRMLKEPLLYGVTPEQLQADPQLRQVRRNLIHSAAVVLEKGNLLRYDRRSGAFQPTELSRIASHFYISHQSMAVYNQHLRPTMDETDIFRVFSLSADFKLIPVRLEEKAELQKLSERVPIPIRENYEEPVAKINILLQAYISQLALEGFALASDMVYVTQSAGRILRALFEMTLRRGWSHVAQRILEVCKMVERRQWRSMTPLRQLSTMSPDLTPDLIRKVERKDFPWDSLFDLTAVELGELVRVPRAGKVLFSALRCFPRVRVDAAAVPLTRSLLRIDLSIKTAFEWTEALGSSEAFWLLVEDVDGETLLHADSVILKRAYAESGSTLEVSVHVPLMDPLPPAYFITLVSDRWLGSQTRIPLMLNNLILPEKRTPPTQLEDATEVLTPAVFNRPQLEAFFHDHLGITQFNALQSALFPALYRSDESVFAGAREGVGKGSTALFAIIRSLIQDPSARILYVVSKTDRIVTLKPLLTLLKQVMGATGEVVELTGDSATDLKLLPTASIILTGSQACDQLSRRWRTRKAIQEVSLVIIDGLHYLASDATLEVILSRMRFMAAQLEKTIRFVALSIPLWNTRDILGWLGIRPEAAFNFDSATGSAVTIQLQTFTFNHYPSMMLAMTRPAFAASTKESSTLIWVGDAKQARQTATDLAAMYAASQSAEIDENNMTGEMPSVQNELLSDCMKQGVAFIDLSLSSGDLQVVLESRTKVIVASRDMLHRLHLPHGKPSLVIVMGTNYYSGHEHIYRDYPMADIFAMLGFASSTALIFCHTSKRPFLTAFLEEAYPLESTLDTTLTDHLNAEIATKTIQSKQEAIDYLTWTLLYRRIAHNPNYYGLGAMGQMELSEFLSELLEGSLAELTQAKCIAVEGETEDELVPLNLGLIAAYYGVSCSTVEHLALSLTASTKIKGILECLTKAKEFATLPMRHHEEALLAKLAERVPMRLAASQSNYSDPHMKAYLLLQAHFSRISLPWEELNEDRRRCVTMCIPLIQATVDVLSSLGHLAPAIAAMEFSQMCIQALWNSDPPIKQLPFFDGSRLQMAVERGVTSIYDLDESLLDGLTLEEQGVVAAAANRYPAMDLTYGLDNESLPQGEDFSLHATVSRQVAADGPVIAPHYPKMKEEGWWIVVGQPSTRTLLGIKRFLVPTEATSVNVSLTFTPPNLIGEHSLKLYLVCDCYAGVDQEFDISVVVDRPVV